MPGGSRVVVTGVGAVAPNGTGTEAFWAACRAGRSGVRRIEAFDPSGLPIRIAGEVPGFDPASILGRDGRTSRVSAFAVAAARECLANAGLDAGSLAEDEREATGVSLGTGGGASLEVERMVIAALREGPARLGPWSVPVATPGTIAGEVSIRLGLKGPSLLASNGCASSTDALGSALLHLRAGRARRFLAGGADAPITASVLHAFHRMRVATASWNDAPEQASRPFCAGRDGFVLGEGAWFLCLETEDAARGRGAPILAELAGYAANCEAFHPVRLDEGGEMPARAMAAALRDAGIAPDAVDAVSLHGTATPMNDRVETRALKRLFGARAPKVPGSALKSLIGHPQGASGAAGAAAAVLSIRDAFLPPTANLDSPDPDCDLDYVPHRGRAARVDTVLCNCIGFGSKNAAVVLRRFER